MKKSMLALLLVGAAVAAYAADCCLTGAACCKPAAPCCGAKK